MPAKNLVQRILEEYKAANPNLATDELNTLSAFGQFAEKWIRDIGIVGMGYTPSGLTLRLRNSDELVLDDSSAVPINYPPNAAIGVTGYAAAPSVTTPSRPTDVSVTGRSG